MRVQFFWFLFRKSRILVPGGRRPKADLTSRVKNACKPISNHDSSMSRYICLGFASFLYADSCRRFIVLPFLSPFYDHLFNSFEYMFFMLKLSMFILFENLFGNGPKKSPGPRRRRGANMPITLKSHAFRCCLFTSLPASSSKRRLNTIVICN